MASGFYNKTESLSKATLVSEFKNDVGLALTKCWFWLFKGKSMLPGDVTHCRCRNREQTFKTENGWDRRRTDKNGWENNCNSCMK